MNQPTTHQSSDLEKIALRKKVAQGYIGGVSVERLASETGRSDAFIYELLRESGIVDIQSPRFPLEPSNVEDAVFTMDTFPITDERKTAATNSIGDAMTPPRSTLDSRTGEPHEWRLSGSDFQVHAFRTEGGYIPSQEVRAVFRVGQQSDIEFFGPYEVRIAECGHAVPVAMLLSLPPTDDAACSSCTVHIDVGKRSTIKPLQRRPLSEAARRFASWETEVQL